MEEKEFSDIFVIPANFNDAGKILGGLLAPRNVLEAVIIVFIFGYLEFTVIPITGVIRIIIMATTLIPIAIVSLFGIDGDSLLQYLRRVFVFLKSRRQLHFRKVGWGDANKEELQK